MARLADEVVSAEMWGLGRGPNLMWSMPSELWLQPDLEMVAWKMDGVSKYL